MILFDIRSHSCGQLNEWHAVIFSKWSRRYKSSKLWVCEEGSYSDASDSIKSLRGSVDWIVQ